MLTGFNRSSYHCSVEMLMIKNAFVHLPLLKAILYLHSHLFFFFLLLAPKIESQLDFTD